MCVCVCVLFLDLFPDELRCLFRPHQVNHGGVQEPPPPVSLYKSHTTEESLRRLTDSAFEVAGTGRYCLVIRPS